MTTSVVGDKLIIGLLLPAPLSCFLYLFWNVFLPSESVIGYSESQKRGARRNLKVQETTV